MEWKIKKNALLESKWKACAPASCGTFRRPPCPLANQPAEDTAPVHLLVSKAPFLEGSFSTLQKALRKNRPRKSAELTSVHQRLITRRIFTPLTGPAQSAILPAVVRGSRHEPRSVGERGSCHFLEPLLTQNPDYALMPMSGIRRSNVERLVPCPGGLDPAIRNRRRKRVSC